MNGKNKTVEILDKITRYSIRASVFLIPLFFLPFGSRALDFHKQALLVLLSMVALAAFVLKSLVEREINIKSPLVSSAILVFVLALSVSTVFSWDAAQSFFGPVGVTSAGLLTWLSLAVFFFLTVNVFETINEVQNLVWVGLSSTLIAGLFGILQAWNVFLLPWNFTQAQSFNTVGSFNSLSLLMAAVMPLVVTLYLVIRDINYKVGLAALGLVSFLVLLLANYWVAWTCLGVGMIGLIVLLKASPPHVRDEWIILPVMILVVAFSFALIQPQLSGLPNPSTEISLTYNSALEMAGKIVRGNRGIGRAVIGTGPGTFTFLYDLFKPKEISESVLWAVNLQRAPSQMLELLATTGILGFLAMLGLIGSFGFVSIKKIIKQQRGKFTLNWALKIGLISGWLVLVTGKFLYPAALSVEFLFWSFMGLFLIITFSNN